MMSRSWIALMPALGMVGSHGQQVRPQQLLKLRHLTCLLCTVQVLSSRILHLSLPAEVRRSPGDDPAPMASPIYRQLLNAQRLHLIQHSAHAHHRVFLIMDYKQRQRPRLTFALHKHAISALRYQLKQYQAAFSCLIVAVLGGILYSLTQ